MEFSQELKSAREKVGMTQKEIAEILGIDKSTYSGYESGKRSPDVPRIKELAKILNVSADKLLGIEKESCKTDASVKQLSTEELFKNFLTSLGYVKQGTDLDKEDYQVLSSVINILTVWFDKKRKK